MSALHKNRNKKKKPDWEAYQPGKGQFRLPASQSDHRWQEGQTSNVAPARPVGRSGVPPLADALV
ncbi:hypothetical protein A4R35_21375 [Thermogemmatispora tikiterensis]|uniref:Uncharacterized protein n=1 Tax=Thermogemmatispora tikiterensis TaxID=1825093 RepID=A0A328VK90_9CHLR|nr:hypothetical protein A4R35_21375 [Thermogemmatispora tikiterensis]